MGREGVKRDLREGHSGDVKTISARGGWEKTVIHLLETKGAYA